MENSSMGHRWDEANGRMHRGSWTAAVDTSGTRTYSGLPLRERGTSLLAGDRAALTHSTGQRLSILLTRHPAWWAPACPRRAATWAAVKLVLSGAPSHTYKIWRKHTEKATHYRTWAVKKKACSSGYQEKSLFLLQCFSLQCPLLTKQCAKGKIFTGPRPIQTGQSVKGADSQWINNKHIHPLTEALHRNRPAQLIVLSAFP